MGRNYLVLDIETVPDFGVWSPAVAPPARIKAEKEKLSKTDITFIKLLVDAIDSGAPIHPSDLEKGLELSELSTDEAAQVKINTALMAGAPADEKQEFAPLYAQRPIVIAHLMLDEHLNILSAGSHAEDDERSLLTTWSGFLDEHRPTLVTWNGRGFDVPVLNLRSLRLGVQQRWYNKDYRYRYGEEHHIDLCDVLAEFGSAMKLKLDGVAKAIGLPGKHGGVDGSKVAGMYAGGEIELIKNYCFTDVVQTAFVFMRLQLVRGRINHERYTAVAEALLNGVRGIPAHADFCALIDEPTLLLSA